MKNEYYSSAPLNMITLSKIVGRTGLEEMVKRVFIPCREAINSNLTEYTLFITAYMLNNN